MTKFLVILILACAAATASVTQSANWPTWMSRAPLNTDSSIVGFSSAMGLAKAYRYLAYLLNAAALAGLLYGLGGREKDLANFAYLYAGVTIGATLLSFALNPLLHLFALLPIILLTGTLLHHFCDVRGTRAALIAVLFYAYQAAYIIIYSLIQKKLGTYRG